MKPNPPIKGHELLYEGRIDTWTGEPRGGCKCGAKPAGWPDVSTGAVRKWHRAHKEALRNPNGAVVEYWPHVSGDWRWHLQAGNGEIQLQGEGYTSESNVLRGIADAKRNLAVAPVRMIGSES